MESGQIIGLIMGIFNFAIGALLALFYKPIGSVMSSYGKKSYMDKIVGSKLYEERNSKRFILILGIWLMIWGVIAFFLFPMLIVEGP